MVSSRANKAAMDDLDREKRLRGESMHTDPATLEGIQVWRRPDVAFDQYLDIDLGGRTVELWHFGPGNGPGDTLVHVPDAKVCWTGQLPGTGWHPADAAEGG